MTLCFKSGARAASGVEPSINFAFEEARRRLAGAGKMLCPNNSIRES